METLEGWLSTAQVEIRLKISRDTVYRLAKEYGWRTIHFHARARMWSAEDVGRTPDAHERRKRGWQKRRSHGRDV